jgi:exodeoxyribonuclease V alpha subunit
MSVKPPRLLIFKEKDDGTVQLKAQEKVLAEICGKVTYVNPKNNKLFQIHAEKMDKKFRCFLSYKNPFCPVREGDALFGVAEYVEDARYGPTLNIIQPPFVMLGQDRETILSNFTSALRGSGFGPMKAQQLLDELILKTGSLNNAINTMDRLSSHFIYNKNEDLTLLQPYSMIMKDTQMLKLFEWWYKNRNLRRLWLLGINNTEIKKANMAPESIYEFCLENPYKVVSLDLNKCDDIMNRIGKPTDPTVRKCGEVARKITEQMENNGWIGIPTGILVKMYPDVAQYIDILREEFDIKTELHTAYLSYPHEVETGLTELIVRLVDGPELPHSMNSHEITYTRNDLSSDQIEAIRGALSNNISIIRGMAGSGKTSVIKEIIHNLDEKGITYRVVSFTGKAVARIREVTERKEAMTMHMSITGSNKKQKSGQFTHLIIDEASMVTSELLYQFMQKFDHDYRITLIGDPHQLTPIGWGLMFEQTIKSCIVPVFTLTNCHRVDNEDNGILLNANSIVECNEEDYNGPAFQFIETDSFNIVDGDISVIRDLINILKDSGIPDNNITVISPYNRDLIEINKMCQDIYNKGHRSVRDINGTVWALNDRVMMTENNYAINVMNGEEGKVTDVSVSHVQVTFKDGSSHMYDLNASPSKNNKEEGIETNTKELTTSSLTHSFGVSVHRYQGSECDFVIFYIPESKPSKFLNRNLLYTGITRGKKIVWMVGDYNTMVRAATTAPAYRCDNLALRLKNTRTIEM